MTQKQPFIISTGQMNLRGVNVLDITVKSSGDGLGTILAPTWELVGGHKRHTHPDDERWQQYEPLTDEQYSDAYLALLRQRYKTNREAFHQIIEQGMVTLVCYCAAEGFCHRHLAKAVLVKIAENIGYEVADTGEIEQLELNGQFKLL